MFITYWFIIFIILFFPVYWIVPNPTFRKVWLLFACSVFYYRFAGPAGVIPILILAVLTYAAGRIDSNPFRLLVIAFCILELSFYKYTSFLISQVFGFINPSLAQHVLDAAKNKILPELPPLGISFFVFEFIHYLIDVYRGNEPIKRWLDFGLFSMFWPSVVAGPVKRYQQFIPALKAGCQRVSSRDIQVGIMRIVFGLIKKLVIADNLTGYIDVYHSRYASMALSHRWVFVFAISLRIFFDFSAYSDIAIGFGRLMGIKLPENFNWPYLATSIQDFWRRWHISLSSWIRDYVYIPLGGNKYGMTRKLTNGIIAFSICGLWHGAAWNFVFWGLYHGVGLAVSSNIKWNALNYRWLTPLKWSLTFVFVSLGWLYFFYPIGEATSMLLLLFKR